MPGASAAPPPTLRLERVCRSGIFIERRDARLRASVRANACRRVRVRVHVRERKGERKLKEICNDYI